MKRYLYFSKCTHGPFELHDLDIMRAALSYNPQIGLTGFLHRTKEHYFQVIEGRCQEVDRLVCKIKADSRHMNFCRLMEENIPYTRFAGWSMGYSRDLNELPELHTVAASNPKAILNFLIEEADRQLEILRAKGASTAPD